MLPPERGGLCPCLFVVVLLALLLSCPVDVSFPLVGASYFVPYLTSPLVGAIACGSYLLLLQIEEVIGIKESFPMSTFKVQRVRVLAVPPHIPRGSHPTR